MSEFEVKRDSWHLRFLAWYTITRDVFEPRGYTTSQHSTVDVYLSFYRRPENFCAYWRSVLLWPAIRFTINLAPYFVGAWALTKINLAGLGFGLLGFFFFIVVSIAILATFAGVVYGAKKGAKKITGAVTNEDQNHFFAMAYKVYKNKFCPYMTFERKK